MLKSSVFALFFFVIVSCVHTENASISQSFYASREKVWEILVAVLKSYPLKTIDEKSGYIETEWIKAGKLWKAPHQKHENFLGYSSIIIVRLNHKSPISWVSVRKKLYRQKGFISFKEEVPSDLLEETVLLYRIARELDVRSRLSNFQ